MTADEPIQQPPDFFVSAEYVCEWLERTVWSVSAAILKSNKKTVAAKPKFVRISKREQFHRIRHGLCLGLCADRTISVDKDGVSRLAWEIGLEKVLEAAIVDNALSVINEQKRPHRRRKLS